LAADEGFAQETAAVFDLRSGFMALQYNHFGPRHGRIQSYLLRFARNLAGLDEDASSDDDHGFTLAAVVKRDSVERLNRVAIVKHLEISVFLPGLAHVEDARKRSLSSILANPILGNAEELRFQIRAARQRGASLNLIAIRQFVREMMGLREEIGTLEVIVKEVEEAPSEPLDLLDARLQIEMSVERTGRRYGRSERWAALTRALDTWTAQGQLV
jgi:hypothetical protein